MISPLEQPTEYSSWEQVAGYFDGDGNVRVEVGIFVLRLGVRFADTWKPQLEAIRAFLVHEGIILGPVGEERRKGKRPMHRLDVGEIPSVIKVMRALLPLCVKKHEDLRIALDYLEDRITGDEAARLLDHQVSNGRRRGIKHTLNMPYTRSKGLRMYELTNARKAREAHIIKVPLGVMRRIRDDHRVFGLGLRRLQKKYGFSQGVLRRILREPEA